MDKIKELVFKYFDEVAFKGVVITHRETYNPYSQSIKTEIEGYVEDYFLFDYVEEHVAGEDDHSLYFDANTFYVIKDLFSLNITQIDEYVNQYLSSLLGLPFNKPEIHYVYLNDN